MSPRDMLMDIPTGRFHWASLLGTAKWPWDISIDSCPSVGLGGRPRGSRDLEQLRQSLGIPHREPPTSSRGRSGSGTHPSHTFTSLLHEAKEVIQELLAFRVLVQFVELEAGEREGSVLPARAGENGEGAVLGAGHCLCQNLASPLAQLACSASNKRLSVHH